MPQEVEGFIVTETPYGESSKIINVLTREKGLIGIMCKWRWRWHWRCKR